MKTLYLLVPTCICLAFCGCQSSMPVKKVRNAEIDRRDLLRHRLLIRMQESAALLKQAETFRSSVRTALKETGLPFSSISEMKVEETLLVEPYYPLDDQILDLERMLKMVDRQMETTNLVKKYWSANRGSVRIKRSLDH